MRLNPQPCLAGGGVLPVDVGGLSMRQCYSIPAGEPASGPQQLISILSKAA